MNGPSEENIILRLCGVPIRRRAPRSLDLFGRNQYFFGWRSLFWKTMAMGKNVGVSSARQRGCSGPNLIFPPEDAPGSEPGG